MAHGMEEDQQQRGQVDGGNMKRGCEKSKGIEFGHHKATAEWRLGGGKDEKPLIGVVIR